MFCYNIEIEIRSLHRWKERVRSSIGEMEYTITDTPTEHEKQEIFEHLLAFNLSRIEDRNPKEIAIFLENENGKKTAGLIGDTHGNWFEVNYFWVSEELRGRGVGKEMLAIAEKTGKDRGCKYAFLNTFGFQAPGFYEKQGYRQKFVLEEYPLTGRRYYYFKELG